MTNLSKATELAKMQRVLAEQCEKVDLLAQEVYANIWEDAQSVPSMNTAKQTIDQARKHLPDGFELRIMEDDYRLTAYLVSEYIPHVFSIIRFEFPASNNMLTDALGHWVNHEGGESRYY